MGENTITVLAVDGLGNKATETRTVRLFPYEAHWQFAGEIGRGDLNVFLEIRDESTSRIQVASATLVVRTLTGEVVREQAMIWEAEGEQYKATVIGLGRGVYTIWGTLEVEGWHVTPCRNGDPAIDAAPVAPGLTFLACDGGRSSARSPSSRWHRDSRSLGGAALD